jgi:hypothetical protein
VLDVAAACELGYKDQARYLSQLLVRDFGTHIITKADAGASLEQVRKKLNLYIIRSCANRFGASASSGELLLSEVVKTDLRILVPRNCLIAE